MAPLKTDSLGTSEPLPDVRSSSSSSVAGELPSAFVRFTLSRMLVPSSFCGLLIVFGKEKAVELEVHVNGLGVSVTMKCSKKHRLKKIINSCQYLLPPSRISPPAPLSSRNLLW